MKRIGSTSQISMNRKSLGVIAILVVVTNLLTFNLKSKEESAADIRQHLGTTQESKLYLLDKAGAFVVDLPTFAKQVERTSRQVDLPVEWLMAIMHAESRFDASAVNKKGSGAAGLVQFKPSVAKEMGISIEQLRNMNHVEQLGYIETYLNHQQQAIRPFNSLTETYLSILYPEALNEDYRFTLYNKPEKDYAIYEGLDEDRDGRITVQDVDRFLKRIYPTAYLTPKDAASGSIFTRVLGFML